MHVNLHRRAAHKNTMQRNAIQRSAMQCNTSKFHAPPTASRRVSNLADAAHAAHGRAGRAAHMLFATAALNSSFKWFSSELRSFTALMRTPMRPA